MSEIIKKMERISDIASKGVGVYEDPNNKDMIIINNGFTVVTISKQAYQSIKPKRGLKKSYGLTKEKAYRISINTRNAYIEAFK